MGLSWEQIVETMRLRREADSPLIRRMALIATHNDGEVKVPLPDVQDSPTLDPLVPTLVYAGIEGTAMLAAQVLPNIHTPAMDSSKDLGVRSLEYAAIRRRALYARWHTSRLPVLLGRAYRQLCGYGTHAWMVVPDLDYGGACIELRDPLTAYPEPRAAEEIRPPANVGFVYGRSCDWILRKYPMAAEYIGTYNKRTPRPNEVIWDLVEWVDDTDIVIGLLGPRLPYSGQAYSEPGLHGQELVRAPNRAGRCTAVAPRRVTLRRLAGQQDQVVPIANWMARLMALEVIAGEKDVFPDMVAIGDDLNQPRIISNGGQWKDGRTGDINLVAGVKAIQQMHAVPGQLTNILIDRLERAGRLAGGISPFYGGENNSSLRTGRAIDSLGGFSIDPRVQELQRIMAYALTDVNTIVMEVEKGYFPDRKLTVFSGWPADQGVVEYAPKRHFETTENVVSFTFPGSDISSITVAVAQLTGAGLMSEMTARNKHPFIEDPDQETRQISEERLDKVIVTGFEQGVASGQIPLEYAARARLAINEGIPFAQAVIDVSEEIKKDQADQAQRLAQGQAGPEVQPGISGQPPPTIQPPNPEQVNLAQLTGALARPGFYAGQS